MFLFLGEKFGDPGMEDPHDWDSLSARVRRQRRLQARTLMQRQKGTQLYKQPNNHPTKQLTNQTTTQLNNHPKKQPPNQTTIQTNNHQTKHHVMHLHVYVPSNFNATERMLYG